MSPWVINRDKSVFGDDAEDFRPERWLDERKKHDMRKCDYFLEQAWLRGLSLTKRYISDRFFFSFGAGSRTCIGKNIAMLEMSKVGLQAPLKARSSRNSDSPTGAPNTLTTLASCNKLEVNLYFRGFVGLKPFYIVARRRNILEPEISSDSISSN